jgi:hypothetical protein
VEKWGGKSNTKDEDFEEDDVAADQEEEEIDAKPNSKYIL